MGAACTAATPARVASMDQFRGLTILIMFAVHYAGRYTWDVNLRPVLGHNAYYLSVGDLAFPWFHLAAGFALRLTLLRRLRTHGPWAAYGRAVRRCVLLILLADGLALLAGPQVSRWGPDQREDAAALLATYLKCDFWNILAILGVTSLWVLPVIGRSARARAAYLLGGLSLHALASQAFYLDFVNGRPNAVDAALGTLGVGGKEGGPLGFLVWAVPQLAGSFVYDLVARERPVPSCRVLLGWGTALVGAGYLLSCLATLYPVVEGPRPGPYGIQDPTPSVASPVIPPPGLPYLADPPFAPPPSERQCVWNYWMMSRHLVTPSFALAATGFGLVVYSLFVLLCDHRAWGVGVLRTLGQNPLIAYFLDGPAGEIVALFWPEGGGWPWALAGAGLQFALTYGAVRFLEWRRIFLRL
jgi:predicted acyltransferase